MWYSQVGTSNVFVVKGKRIFTPPLVGGGEPSDTILEGVTRESVIQVHTHARPRTNARARAPCAGSTVLSMMETYRRWWRGTRRWRCGSRSSTTTRAP